jgi:hypothetical protein
MFSLVVRKDLRKHRRIWIEHVAEDLYEEEGF